MAADAAAVLANDEDAEFSCDASPPCTGDQRLPVLHPGLRQGRNLAPASPITPDDVAVAVPEAEAELAVGFGSRYERATPAEREY